MKNVQEVKRIAIVGGGPSGLFTYKRLVESGRNDLEIDIFEKKAQLGAGMPYSTQGANDEHVTNVSGNEIPSLVTSLVDWLHTVPSTTLNRFGISLDRFNEYKVVPRLLFGLYLSNQFDLLYDAALKGDIVTKVHLNSRVVDIVDKPMEEEIWVQTENSSILKFDAVLICTGHTWPLKYENKVPGYYDSPYPTFKLGLQINHPVAIRGSSLTAIDAIRTLARHNGTFITGEKGTLSYQPSAESPDFKLIIHSRNGMLPAIRFHLEDSELTSYPLLTDDQILNEKAKNGGFLSLDYVFEKEFKDLFCDKDPVFYRSIKEMRLEEFVDMVMGMRESEDPFQLFKKEYAEAEQSIQQKESIHWKELLAVLSFAMNQPAKHFSAEDMLRLQKVLMPLISIVIAFVPQSSCRELLALHEAAKLDIVTVGTESHIQPETDGITYCYTDESQIKQAVRYHTFVDCIGQAHLSYEEFPFKSLLHQKVLSPARLLFQSKDKGKQEMDEKNETVELDKDGHYYLRVPGVAINDHFQVVNSQKAANPRLYIMAVPYIGGFNPDYSGLDFCASASEKIVKSMLQKDI